MEHWAAVSTLLGLIRSVYRDPPPHWKLNQRPQNAEPKIYHWATGPQEKKKENVY